MESGELIFLRYAFPVIGYCNKIPVSADEISKFQKMLRIGGFPDKKRLEQLFPNAVKHLKSWSQEDVQDYWLRKHNEIVEDNLLCRVYGFKVSEILPPSNGEICRAKVGKNSVIETKSYIPLQPGDLVSVHGFQVAEKLSRENFDRYFRQ